jgi:chromosomal replication initiation ATPase DnaA
MTTREIIGQVAIITGVPVGAITGRRRTRTIIIARTLALATIARESSWMTTSQITEIFGQTHTNFCHSTRRHQLWLATDPTYRRLWTNLQSDLLFHSL